MTKVILFKKEAHFIGLEVKGHAGYANKGSDIVCADIQVEIVTQIFINLLETLQDIEANYQNHLKVKIENK